MKKVQVVLPGVSYDILIGPGLLAHAGSHIVALSGKEKAVVISDENVWRLYGTLLSSALLNAAITFETVVLPAGEHSKSLAGLEQVYQGFADAQLQRGGLVVAFGGGVVGDLAGFAAATWMRGVRCAQIPTSLLAQVDSSVGGKTAIDLPYGKNLVGAFHQPRLVLADTDVLSTLPPVEFACGMAEIIKYGAIRSRTFFEQLATPAAAPSMEDIIKTCCAIKRDIVQRDELDHGERMLLNFGHTLGHAVEALGGYTRYNHGQAVAVGMVLAARLGEALGVTAPGCADALRETLARWKLPTNCPYSLSQMMPHVALDKKRRAGGVDMVLLKNLGEATTMSLPLDNIKNLLEEVPA